MHAVGADDDGALDERAVGEVDVHAGGVGADVGDARVDADFGFPAFEVVVEDFDELGAEEGEEGVAVAGGWGSKLLVQGTEERWKLGRELTCPAWHPRSCWWWLLGHCRRRDASCGGYLKRHFQGP